MPMVRRKEIIMAKLTLKTASLEKGEEVTIHGVLNFSYYLTHLLDGDKLEKACAKNEYKLDVPHYEATIEQVSIKAKDKEKPTDAEKVIANKCYNTKTRGKCFSFEKKPTKNGFLGILTGEVREDGLIHPVNITGKNLAEGQGVTLTYKCVEYEYKGKKGLTLRPDTLVFDERIRYFEPTPREGWAKADEVVSETETANTSDEEVFE